MIENMKEQNGVMVEGHIKIFDPKSAKYLLTKETLFIMRI